MQTALVVMLLLLVAVSVAEAVYADSLIDRAARTVGADPAAVALEHSENLSGVLFAGIPAVLLAVWLGVTAWWMRRRSNVARVLALVGLAAPVVLGALACLAGGVLMVLLAGMLFALPEGPEDVGDTTDFDGADWGDEALLDELDRLSGSGWPVAFDVIGGSVGFLALLLAVSTGVLLLVGSSRRYFQPPRVVAVNPYLGSGPGIAGYGLGVAGPPPVVPVPVADPPTTAPPPATDVESPG